MKKSKKIQKVDQETGEIITNRIKTWSNASQFPKDYEKNSMPSKTVPGQTMTVAEMVARYRKGLPIDQTKGALYQGEELLPNIDHMDLIERAEYMDSVADALVEIRAKLESEAKTNQEKEFLKKVDIEVRARMQKLRDDQDRNKISDIEKS